jgi:hypothetical protein
MGRAWRIKKLTYPEEGLCSPMSKSVLSAMACIATNMAFAIVGRTYIFFSRVSSIQC